MKTHYYLIMAAITVAPHVSFVLAVICSVIFTLCAIIVYERKA